MARRTGRPTVQSTSGAVEAAAMEVMAATAATGGMAAGMAAAGVAGTAETRGATAADMVAVMDIDDIVQTA